VIAFSTSCARLTSSLALFCALLAPSAIAAQENTSDIVPSGPPLVGAYECYAFTGGILVGIFSANFTVTGAGTYADVDGAAGSLTFDQSGIFTFVGAAMDGQHAFFEQRPNTLPNVNILNDLGERGATDCEFQPNTLAQLI
jgi:hypothetical protein